MEAYILYQSRISTHSPQPVLSIHGRVNFNVILCKKCYLQKIADDICKFLHPTSAGPIEK